MMIERAGFRFSPRRYCHISGVNPLFHLKQPSPRARAAWQRFVLIETEDPAPSGL